MDHKLQTITPTQTPEHPAAQTTPSAAPEPIPEQFPSPSFQIVNDISKQTEKKEQVYVPREWVTSKLEQIKANSSLNAETTAIPETLRIEGNTLSVDIRTQSGLISTMQLQFFEDGIIKLNCLNPYTPTKFSFELIDKPANLTAYSITEKSTNTDHQVEVTVSEIESTVQMTYNPFNVKVISTKDRTTVFEMNTSKCLTLGNNLTADFTFHNEHLYGLPERAHSLSLIDTKQELPYRFYNQDVPGYPIGSKNSLYGAVPVIVSRAKDSARYVSMYWQNTSDTYIDIHKVDSSSKAYWLSERGNLECYVFLNPTPSAHFRSMTHVFGHCAMPQYFSLGYHQCRWSYNDQQDLLHVNGKFNEHEIPCDTLTLDIDHTNGCRYFTWNEKAYPDPVDMQETLAKDGRQLVTIADPHIKVDQDYSVYKEVLEKDLYIKTKDNKPFVGKCWPGESLYYDYLNEEARDSWASQYSFDKYKKSIGNLWAWNDMNEPSVFEIEGNHMPLDNIQTFKSVSEPEKTFQLEHREVHNIYGYCQHKATYEGLIKRTEYQNIRPHVLSRSFYAGSQKWTTVWTGDTRATWEYLRVTVPQMLSLSLCGISNCGGDVGGFIGNPDSELAVRWYQLGMFMPYFRAHSEITSKRREPWLFEKQYFEIIRETIRDRYRFLPYWYTCFEEHCRTGVPVLRPVWFGQEKIADESVFREQERFMVGDSLMVNPIMEPGKNSISGVLRGLEGRWYDYYNKKEVQGDEEIKTGLERIGCLVKGGSVVPMFDVRNWVKSSKDARECSVNLCVGLDGEESARGKMYFDDGETFNYRKGEFARKEIEFNRDTLSWNGEEGGFELGNRVTKAVVMGVNPRYKEAYLYEGALPKQKIQMFGNGLGGAVIEFVAKASKNWKILLR